MGFMPPWWEMRDAPPPLEPVVLVRSLFQHSGKITWFGQNRVFGQPLRDFVLERISEPKEFAWMINEDGFRFRCPCLNPLSTSGAIFLRRHSQISLKRVT